MKTNSRNTEILFLPRQFRWLGKHAAGKPRGYIGGWLAVALLLAAGKVAAQHEYEQLWSFGFEAMDPTGLAVGRDGTLYGVAFLGGSSGGGTVFKFDADGAYQELHGFPSGNRRLLQYPTGVLQGTDGALYGTTGSGGNPVAGAIFRLSPDGTGFAQLHNFGASRRYGSGAWNLIEGVDGELYGLSYSDGVQGKGAVFRLRKNGRRFVVLRSFSIRKGDGYPRGLADGRDGQLYGTTAGGNRTPSGTVFKVGRNGAGYKILHTFRYGDGDTPAGQLLKASDGFLYGVTYAGGTSGQGTIFRLRVDGSGFRVLHSFTGGEQGSYPQAGLIEGSDGVLYGTTIYGGHRGQGTLFRLSKDETRFAVVLSFTNRPGEGTVVAGTPVANGNGDVFVATLLGGSMNHGNLIRFRPAPILELDRTSNGLRWSFAAVANQQYELQSAPTVHGPWNMRARIRVPGGGRVEYGESVPSAPTAFYRVWRMPDPLCEGGRWPL